jgi:hypothetical protein
MRLFVITLITFVFISISGCEYYPKPRLRFGAYFGAPLGIEYPDPQNLGKHQYLSCWGEKIGLVYTSRGGFIDMGHLRDSADRTTYCKHIIYENLLKGNKDFSFRLLEPSKYFVTIKYPENWNELPNKKEAAREISIGLGQYFAYEAMVWHEIIGWYGYKYSGIFPEYISAFSWEDVYSDLVGTQIASRALRENSDNYENTMTKLIYEELQYLDAQPVSTGKKAERTVRGKWYDGIIYPVIKLKKRNLDIGLEDEAVTPWLVPGICKNSEPLSYAVPKIDFLQKYGISAELKIRPDIFESKKILKVAYPEGNGKYIIPSKHFPEIMKDITMKEKARNGNEVNVPNL